MTERFVSDTLDLSNLPAPEVIKDVSYEAILAERLVDLVARYAAIGITLDVTMLETDPTVILQQEDAYREALTKQAINDAAKSVMLAFATGGTLDNLAAFYGVARLVITPADPETNTPAVLESDDSLRARTQLAPEALPYAGLTGGGYRALALKSDASIKNVNTVRRDGGRVDVVLLSRNGDGAVSDDVVSTVAAVFRDDESTQLTDVVTVRSADILHYTLDILLKIPRGPSPATITAAARASVQAYAASCHLAGEIVYDTGVIAAAKVGGVKDVVLQNMPDDIDPGPYGAAYCTAVTVTYEVI